MMIFDTPHITSLMNRDFTYLVLSLEGEILQISDMARKIISCREGDNIKAILKNNALAPWSNFISDSMQKSVENGSHTEDMWFIDKKGQIHRYTHRYQHCVAENVIVVIWFEVKDRLNRLLKSYDRKRSRFCIWNDAHITVKELRTIAYYIQGLSYKAIAKQEHISHAAVSARLQSIAQKAGFESVPALHTALFDELYRDAQLPQLFNIVQ